MSEIREGAPEGATHYHTSSRLYYKVVGDMVLVTTTNSIIWVNSIVRDAELMDGHYTDVIRIKTLEEVMDEYLGD